MIGIIETGPIQVQRAVAAIPQGVEFTRTDLEVGNIDKAIALRTLNRMKCVEGPKPGGGTRGTAQVWIKSDQLQNICGDCYFSKDNTSWCIQFIHLAE